MAQNNPMMEMAHSQKCHQDNPGIDVKMLYDVELTTGMTAARYSVAA